MSGIAPDKPIYQVLARKYRPTNFADLIGQDALVRTLSNAIETNRIAHAFLLTGIRGIGKTTTARIIARTLNCVGPDGKGNPTISPCGVCEHCVAIKEDRHPDILEMDAASRTGVGDIREIIDNCRYLPTIARYKIYIIDEVHMLSNNAFNALLKTLEEPPAHVKFIFATTEIRKIPVTILSRCQRFDLRRLDNALLSEHLENICTKEGSSIHKEALSLLASAAEGSVRDGLSLLDQAIAYSNTAGSKEILPDIVREMLGLADKGAIFTLLEKFIGNRIEEGLQALHQLYEMGGDPAMIIQDTLEIINLVTRFKLSPALSDNLTLTETERTEGKKLAETLSVPFLSRAWQLLLKGLQEVHHAPNSLMAAEMVFVRLGYVSDLPTPSDLIRKIKKEGTSTASVQASAAPVTAPKATAPVAMASLHNTIVAIAAKQEIIPETEQNTVPIASFIELTELFNRYDEPRIYHTLREEVHLVHFEPGKIEFRPTGSAPTDLAGRMSTCLHQWTGTRWGIIISKEEGEPTLFEQEEDQRQQEKVKIASHSQVKAILDSFPGATITHIRNTNKGA